MHRHLDSTQLAHDLRARTRKTERPAGGGVLPSSTSLPAPTTGVKQPLQTGATPDFSTASPPKRRSGGSPGRRRLSQAPAAVNSEAYSAVSARVPQALQ